MTTEEAYDKGFSVALAAAMAVCESYVLELQRGTNTVMKHSKTTAAQVIMQRILELQP